jgi:hypothetical protein
VGCGGALPTQEFTKEAGPAPGVVDVWEQAEYVIGVLTSGAVAGDPALPSGEDLALVVVERRAARRLVVGDEAVELVEGGQRVGLLESPVDGVDHRRAGRSRSRRVCAWIVFGVLVAGPGSASWWLLLGRATRFGWSPTTRPWSGPLRIRG